MDPIVTGALISAGSSLASGLLGSSSAKATRRAADNQFEAQMDQTIQRRVGDARKAGIHPLYALGVQPGASPTIIAGQHGSGSALGEGIAQAGAALANIPAAKADRRAAELQRIAMLEQQDATIEAAKAAAAADRALAAVRLSDLKRSEQESLHKSRTPDPNAIPQSMLFDPGKKGSLSVYGKDFPQRRQRSWADDWSQRYGEPGEWVGGILGFLEDVGSALGNKAADWRGY